MTETTKVLEERDEQQAAPPAPVAGGALLTADQVLANADPKRLEYVDVAVPEWTPAGADEPLKIRLRVMTADEAIEFAQHQAALNAPRQPGQAPPKQDAIQRLVCKCAVDEDGNPIFNEQQLEQLGGLSFAVLQRLQDKALVLNGFAEEDDAQESAGNG